MNLAIYQSHLTKMIAHRNGYLILAFGMLVICLLQTIMIFHLYGKEKIVVVPPAIEKSFWVSSTNVSPEYLSEMTTFFTQLRLNMTPENANFQRETLLRYTDPAYYNVLNEQLVQERDKITEQHISMAFYPINVRVSSNKFQAIIDGDLKVSVGDVFIPTKRIKYLVSYRFDDGRLLIKSFKEINHA